MRCNLALALVATFAAGASAATVYTEDWDDGMGFSRWSLPIVDAELGFFDGLVNYNFDYSTVGIPPAPSSAGTTVGARFEANIFDNGPVDEGVGVGIIANDAEMPSVDFELSAEVYYLLDPSVADFGTQYITLGAFASGPKIPLDSSVNDEVPLRFGLSNGDGLSWQVTGDGGSATDVIRYEDPGNADAGSQTNILSLDDIPFGDIPGVTTGAGNPNDPFEPFGLQGRWVTLSIESTDGLVEFQINGVTVDSFDNSSDVFSGGSVMLGLTDIFNSAVGESGLLMLVVDNVELTAIPEPTSAVLGLVALVGFAARRRG